jgi:hypothetical protein
MGLFSPFFYYLKFKIMKNDVKDLQGYFCPFGYLDLQAICEI